MRLHRFYTTETIGNKREFTLDSAELLNQVRRVFRLNNKDFILVFDGSGFDYECVITGFVKDSIALNVVSVRRSHYMPLQQVYLFASVVKKDTFEWIVEKATELGVTHIIPVMAERSEKKALNDERLAKIAIEASEQSGRGNIPVIHPIIALNESLTMNPNLSMVAFHTDAQLFSKSDFKENIPLGLFIGPEGGWSESEVEAFHKNEIPLVSLGNQVLRAETAVVAALSVVMLGK